LGSPEPRQQSAPAVTILGAKLAEIRHLSSAPPRSADDPGAIDLTPRPRLLRNYLIELCQTSLS
jgi:hypothetical protein